MEELLKQLLEGQKQLLQLFEGQKQLSEGQKRMESRLDKLDKDIITVKEEMGTKIQQNENNRLIDALLHRTEEMDARFDGLLHNTASKENITALSEQHKVMHERLDRMAMDVNFLVRKAAEHEADIFEFKKAR